MQKKGPIQVGPKAEWLLSHRYGYIVTRAIWLITSPFDKFRRGRWFLTLASWLRLGAAIAAAVITPKYFHLTPDVFSADTLRFTAAVFVTYVIALYMEENGNTTSPFFWVWTVLQAALIGAFWGIIIRAILLLL